MKYIQWKTKKKKKKLAQALKYSRFPYCENSIRKRTLLKLLLGFNSKDEVEEEEEKNTFPFKVGRKLCTAKNFLTVLNILTQYLYIWFLSVN